MINWSRISELKDEIGEEDFTEVVDLFLEEVDEGIEILRAIQDHGQIGPQLHFLKGSAMNLGFSEFSEHCESGENAVANGFFDQFDMGTILRSYEASKSYFIDALSDH